MNRHPMRVVTRRTGLKPDVLRAWERRHAAVRPQRSAGGHRYYSDEDIHRLRLLREATEAGRNISQLAGMPLAELEDLVQSDREAAGETFPLPDLPAGQIPGDAVEQCLRAARALDEESLQAILDRAAVDVGQTAVIDRVLVPLLHRIGDLWAAGDLRPAHEHLVSAVTRSFLAQIARPYHVPATAPEVIVTTPSGQFHEFGALLAAGTAAAAGWNATYLGPSLPAEEIAGAVRQRGARAVALSIGGPTTDVGLEKELRRLGRLIGDGVRILVGGRNAATMAPVIEEIGAVELVDLADLRTRLRELRGTARAGASLNR